MLVVKVLSLHSDHWKYICETLHNPRSQKKNYQKDMKSIKNEARTGEIEDLYNFIIDHLIKEES